MLLNSPINIDTYLKRPPQKRRKTPAASFEDFCKYFEPSKEYTVKEFVHWHNQLTDSCPEGRVIFCHMHSLRWSGTLTVFEFFDFCEADVYGKETIEELEKFYRIYYGLPKKEVSK